MGADAVYLGLKQLSARASATNFTLEELAVLLPFAHRRNVSIYVALNSILTAGDIPRTLDLLQALDDLKVDALIDQIQGCSSWRQFFPDLRLHASTLMGDSQPCRGGAVGPDGGSAGGPGAGAESKGNRRDCPADHGGTGSLRAWGALLFLFRAMPGQQFPGRSSRVVQGRCVQPPFVAVQTGPQRRFLPFVQEICASSLPCPN